MRGPYRNVGKNFEEANVTHNKNMDDVWKDMQTINADSKKTVSTALEARTESIMAKTIARSAEKKADQVQKGFDEVIADGDSNAEVAASRVGSDGETQDSLPSRLLHDYNSLVNEISKTNFVEGITSVSRRDEQASTTYYITYVPSSSGVEIQHGLPESTLGETARSFANRNETTLTVNGGIFHPTEMTLSGVNIVNGVIQSDRRTDRQRYILAFAAGKKFKVFNPQTTAAAIMGEGYDNALTGFIPIVLSGAKVNDSILGDYEQSNNRNPCQIIGQRADGSIVFLTSDGRTTVDLGMTMHDAARIMLGENVEMAFVIDGGGSAQTVVRGRMVNKPIDDSGKTERRVCDFLYFKQEDTSLNKDSFVVSADSGNIMKKVHDLESDLYQILDTLGDVRRGFVRLYGPNGYADQGIESFRDGVRKTKLFLKQDELAYWSYDLNKTVFRATTNGDIITSKGTIGAYYSSTQNFVDANLINVDGPYWFFASTGVNTPDNISAWVIWHSQLNTNTALQKAVSFGANEAGVRKRRKVNGVWEPWGRA